MEYYLSVIAKQCFSEKRFYSINNIFFMWWSFLGIERDKTEELDNVVKQALLSIEANPLIPFSEKRRIEKVFHKKGSLSKFIILFISCNPSPLKDIYRSLSRFGYEYEHVKKTVYYLLKNNILRNGMTIYFLSHEYSFLSDHVPCSIINRFIGGATIERA